MDGVISVKDLISFILFLLGATAVVYLVIVLHNVNKLVKQVNLVIADNKTNIDKTMEVMPEVANNLNSTVVSIKGTVDRTGNIIDNFEGTVSEVAASFEDTSESIIDVIKASINVIKTIMSLFSKN